jgi:hypothetical protein
MMVGKEVSARLAPGYHDEGCCYETAQLDLVPDNHHRIGYFVPTDYFKFAFQSG